MQHPTPILQHPLLGKGRIAFRVSEVAEMTGISKSQIYAMVASGEIGSKKAGRSVVVPLSALLAWLDTGDELATA